MTYTDDELDRIISLTGKSKADAIRTILDREVDRLKREAQGSSDEDAFKDIAEKRKKYKDKLMASVKARKQSTGKGTGQLNVLSKIIDMNIFHNGNLLSAANLNELDLTGKIEVRNPKSDIFDNNAFASELAASGNLGRNLQRIKDIITESKAEVKDVEITSNFPLDKFLGSIDASKGENRKDIYDYWNSIANIFPQLKKDAEELLKVVSADEDLPEDLKEKFERAFDMEDFDRLQYIAKFPLAKGEVLEARHRFFNIVAGLISAEKLFDAQTVRGKGFEDDDAGSGDISGQLAQEMAQGIEDAIDANVGFEKDPQNNTTPKGWNDEIDMTLIDDGVEWLNDVSLLQAQADPLLMYEHNKGNKLVSMTEEGEAELVDLLSDAIDEIEEAEERDGQRITGFTTSLDFKTDIERWLNETEDTSTLDNDVEFWLPVSVMDNADFDDLYPKEKYFDGVEGYEFVTADDLEEIEDLFEDLYNILSKDIIAYAGNIRTSKGRRRGTDMRETMRGIDPRTNRLAAASKRQFRQVDSLSSEIKDELLSAELKGALEKFMETALEYYFTPAYSGRLPIQIPSFMGTIGGRVMQTLSLDLGLETVMSGSYKKLMQGSAKSFKETDLENIADFLEMIFLKSIKIDAFLIAEGERAARSLTRIFGKKEENNQYIAGLIHYFMVETGDIERENNKFNGVPISERADKFEFGYKSRRAYPIFALPHWLDMNQGLITQKSPKAKTQYNRLKTIFEQVQGDLPVLIHKMLKAHDAIREQLGLPVIHGFFPMNSVGYETIINKMYVEDNLDLSNYEVETIVKALDSHQNISKEFGISTEQVYAIKAHFR